MTFTPPAEFITRPDLVGRFGMTSSTHWLATGTAQSVLERGGTAFDAAVAGGFVLHLVEPHLNGPGGDLVGIYATADEPSRPRVLMGQGPAPAGATIEHLRGEGLDLVPGAGALAAAVPGAVDAWLLLLRDHGTWELADVLAYALAVARDGHPLSPGAARTIATVAELFREAWPTSADRWLVDGAPPEAGHVVRNEAWAAVLDRLIEVGASASEDLAGEDARRARIDAARDEWAGGSVAEAVDAFVRIPHRHSSGAEHTGVLRASDLAAFRASVEDAVTTTFRGRTIAKAGAWSQGPALLQMLAILDPLPDERLDPSTVEGAHTVLETMKLALADREAYYGDHAVALDALLSPAYAEERRALIEPRASAEFRPGAAIPAGTLPPLRTEYAPPERRPAFAGVGEPTVGSPSSGSAEGVVAPTG